MNLKKIFLMAMILVVLGSFLSYALTYSTLFNPFTGKLDYISTYNETDSMNLSQLTLAGTICSSGYVLTTTGTGLLTCVVDATASGGTSIGFGYLYNISGSMFLNDTKLNATYDTRYLRSVSMPFTNLTGTLGGFGYTNLTGTASIGYSNLTGSITIGYNNLTGTANLGYANLSGTISISTANITSGTLDDARLSANVTKTGTRIPYTNLTGTLTSFGYNNLTGTATLSYDNLTGSISLSQNNITGITIPLVNTTGVTSVNCTSGQVLYNASISNGVLNGKCIAGGSGVTTITRGEGFNLTGTDITSTGTLDINSSIFQKRVTFTCAAGSSISAIDIGGATGTCETDDVGAAGSGSIGVDFLNNISNNMYLNTTYFNATYDTRYMRSVSLPYTNLTGTIVLSYANLTGTASLGYTNLSGTITLSTANITSGTFSDSLLSTNMTNLKNGVTSIAVGNLTAGTLGAGWTWNGNVITSSYIGSHTLSYSNLTGTLGGFGYTNLTGTLGGFGYTNLTGTVSLTPINITGITNSHLHAYTNLTGTANLGYTNLTGTASIGYTNLTGTITLTAANITTGNLNLSSTGIYTINNASGMFFYSGGTCRGYLMWNGTGMLLNASGC